MGCTLYNAVYGTSRRAGARSLRLTIGGPPAWSLLPPFVVVRARQHAQLDELRLRERPLSLVFLLRVRREQGRNRDRAVVALGGSARGPARKFEGALPRVEQAHQELARLEPDPN